MRTHPNEGVSFLSGVRMPALIANLKTLSGSVEKRFSSLFVGAGALRRPIARAVALLFATAGAERFGAAADGAGAATAEAGFAASLEDFFAEVTIAQFSHTNEANAQHRHGLNLGSSAAFCRVLAEHSAGTQQPGTRWDARCPTRRRTQRGGTEASRRPPLQAMATIASGWPRRSWRSANVWCSRKEPPFSSNQ